MLCSVGRTSHTNTAWSGTQWAVVAASVTHRSCDVDRCKLPSCATVMRQVCPRPWQRFNAPTPAQSLRAGTSPPLRKWRRAMAVSCATTCARVAKTTGLETLALWPGGQTEHLVEGRALDPRTVRTDRNCAGQQVPQSGQTRDCDNQKPDASATVRPDSTLRRSEKIRKRDGQQRVASAKVGTASQFRRSEESCQCEDLRRIALATVSAEAQLATVRQSRNCGGQTRVASLGSCYSQSASDSSVSSVHEAQCPDRRVCGFGVVRCYPSDCLSSDLLEDGRISMRVEALQESLKEALVCLSNVSTPVSV